MANAAPDRLRIVFVEDVEELRLEMEQFLQRHFDVTACATVAAARQLLTEAIARGVPPDVLVTDVNLDDGDAGDLYAAFAERMPGCRWILVSGDVDLGATEGKIESVAGPPPLILVKPISLRALRRHIEGGET